MKKLSLLSAALLFSVVSVAQLSARVKTYAPGEVFDNEKSISIYEKLNPTLGGDSIRNDRRGYACQGWVEDKYQDGAVLHKGLYVDGQLSFYRNYFPNGKVERVFRRVDPNTTLLHCFYSNGKLKSEVSYINGRAANIHLFYESGVTKYVEQYDSTMSYLVEKSSYYTNGDPESELVLTDRHSLLYKQVEYNKDGGLKVEGYLKYNNGIARFSKEQYVRDGYWKVYNDYGDLAQEMFFMNGMPADPTKVSTSGGNKKGKRSN